MSEESEFFLVNPVATSFVVTDSFNSPRVYKGVPQRHEGIDLRALAADGRPVAVLAAQRGVVNLVVPHKVDGYGTHVRVVHNWPDGTTWVTWYGHLSQIDPTITIGTLVQAGQRLGIAGTTGNSTGIHLHLTLQHIGRGLKGYVVDDVVDPRPFFRNTTAPAVDVARFDRDVTVPDGMQVQPGQPFEKKWRIRNTGGTTWGNGYTLAFFGDNQMGGPAAVPLPPLKPGEFGEAAVLLIAPTTAGRHRSTWKGRNPRGDFFPFEQYAEIVVVPVVKRDDAVFVSDETVPDGTVVRPGQTFLKTWKARNTGDTTWGAGYGLAFFGDQRMDAPPVVTVPTTRPNSLVPLSVSLKAPSAPGIYRSTWQMRNPEGQFFGEFFYVEIVVAPPIVTGTAVDAATFVDDVTVPDGTRVIPGEKLTKVWRLRNSGTTTWGTGYVLAFLSDNQMGAPNTIPLPHAAPGATADVTVPLTAPNAAGRYRSTWRPRKPNGAVFGDFFYTEIEVVKLETRNDARFVNDLSIPDGTVIQVGQVFHKTWRLRNAGTAAWGAGYALAFLSDARMGAPDRVPLPQALPGQEVDVTVTFTAPPTAGVLRSTWRPRDPSGVFFGDYFYAEIRVPDPQPPLQAHDSRLEGHETIPNGMEMTPGNAFVKTWAVRNSGTTTWGPGYTLAFVDGGRLGALGSVVVPATEPQRVVRLSVSMKAPPSSGKYSGRWRLRDPQGNFFGSTFFVSIVVAPVAAQMDLLPYLQGDGRLYEMKHIFQTAGGQLIGQQRVQTQTDGGRFYVSKNQEWEELWADGDFIYRGSDTSPGMGNFYTLTENGRYGSPWTPRKMAIGQAFLRSPTVTSRRKSNCAINPQLSGLHQTWIKLEARHERLTLPDVEGRPTGGIKIQDVIVLTAHHNHSNQPSAQPFERYYYARNVGLVMWEGIDVDHRGRSFMIELHQPGARPNNVREQIPCLEAIRRGGNT